MGQVLSEPVTTKQCTKVHNSLYRVGSCSMQGWRVSMEDTHAHILSLTDYSRAAFFAVYDGHGCPRIAEYAKQHLHKYIVERPEYNRGDIVGAMENGFLDIDAAMMLDGALGGKECGSTANCVIIRDNKVYCANAGDSRAIACVNGMVLPLSEDHKPSDPEEKRRILAAGGYVQSDRVNGNLTTSRALGDYKFKNRKLCPREQAVTALPDVIEEKLTPDWEFVVMACDGIWEVMSNEEVAEFVRGRVARGMEPEDICTNLMDHCISQNCEQGGVGCDNMTVILIYLLHDKPLSQLIEKCSQSPQS